MRGHRRFGILLAALAVFLLLPLSGRPVKADTSALELYVPQETEEQQEHPSVQKHYHPYFSIFPDPFVLHPAPPSQPES